MPATYQIVPYVINVQVRGNATELRPLWDLDARGATMQSAIRGIASAARGRNFVDPSDDRRRLQVKSVKCGAGTVFVEWEPGRAGIESNIHREDGSSVPRRAADTEYIPVRHLFFLPPGGYNGFLLAERVGVHGAVTMAATLLRASFNARHDTLRLVVQPAMTAEVLKRQIDQQPVKALVFKRPRENDPTGRNMLVAGQSVSVEIRMRPGRNKFWRRDQLLDNEGTLLGVLNPVLQADVQSGPSIEQLIGDGWEASYEVIMPNRTTRLVSVAQTRSTTMSFPILPPDKDEGLRRPSDDEFREGCASVISVFAGGHGPAAESASNCRWEAAEWALGPDDEPWKVVWR